MSSKIVRLILSSGDIEGSMDFTMYNVIRESIKTAENILSRGGRVGIEILEEKGGSIREELISTQGGFLAWKDSINRVALVNRPLPMVKPLETRRFFHQKG